AIETGEPGEALAVVGNRVSGADGCLIGIAEDLAHEPGLHVRPPGDAGRRRDVVPVRLVTLGSLLEQDVLRTDATQGTGCQEVASAVGTAIADTRSSADALHRDRRHDAGERG